MRERKIFMPIVATDYLEAIDHLPSGGVAPISPLLERTPNSGMTRLNPTNTHR